MILYICVAVLLLGAAYTDIKCGKISNIWLLIWIPAGIYLRGYVFIILSIAVCLLLYILYLCKMMGAGDIKLLAVLYGYLGMEEATVLSIIGMVCAAAFSVYKLYKNKLFIKRIGYFISYIEEFKRTGKIKKYYDETRDGREIIIPMAPYFLLGFILELSIRHSRGMAELFQNIRAGG